MGLPTRELCLERLGLIFPEELAQRGRMTGQLPAAAVFVFLYVRALEGERKLRPSMVVWMCDEAAKRKTEAERDAWYRAALAGKQRVETLLQEWGINHRPWYADNTREPLRDETFRSWASYGALVRDETGPTTSSAPQWAMNAEFAALFDSDLAGDELNERIADWQDDHLGAVGLARIAVAHQLSGPGAQVLVTLPGGAQRTLAPGGSSLILKGVLELCAPKVLEQPSVLFISESRRHVDVVDAQLLAQLQIELKPDRLLPDALLFDAGPGIFWFVEAVFTDGPIDETRKAAFLSWADEHGIAGARCSFLTAFAGRTAPPFRRLVSSLAWGSHVWFLDEPDKIVRLDVL